MFVAALALRILIEVGGGGSEDFVGKAIRGSLPQSVIEEGEVSVILVGDIMLGRTVASTSLAKQDWNYPFLKVAEYLNSSDLVFGNLENPIVSQCPISSAGTVFCALPDALAGLLYAGVDVVSLANNHIGDQGLRGTIETEKHLSEQGIDYTGRGELLVKEVGNTKFGFLGFNLFNNNLSQEDLDLIHDSDKMVDVLIVGVHWGVEYTPEPTEIQRVWAAQMVAEGADVIAGHHPHWVQSIDYIDGSPVYYSLGNFVFDQMWSEPTRRGMVVRLTFKNGKLLKEMKREIYMDNWAQPEFLE